ncbi:MAG: sulfurtransferase TusA family protein [Humibacillus sp.]|nr:sulfurtransferase TusA family protein [Humibacillus sp.]MDN5779557.1 sulfurtransferase TusA family protein [Humibacillus sp.]
MRCPLPVIRLARLVGDNPGVREVTVLATDPAATHDIPAWCRMRGHLYLGAQDCGGHTAHRVGVRPTRPATGP